jgi:hypothetical protein
MQRASGQINRLCVKNRVFQQASDTETLSTAAFAGHVRIAEAKCLIETFFHEIDLGTIDELETGLVDHDLDAAFLEYDIASLDFVGIVDDIGKSVTAGLLDADPQADSLPLESR